MGSLYPFTCDHCSYEADVSGGFDRGMISATQTIACQDCGILMDVGAGDAPTTSQEDAAAMTLHCPKSSKHKVTPWNHPGYCPKCGKTMSRGDVTTRWD